MLKHDQLIRLSSLKLKNLKAYRLKSLVLTFFLKTLTVATVYIQKASLLPTKFIYKQSKWTRRCLLTARTPAVDSRLKVSRFVYRSLVTNGFAAGVKRYSW